MSKIKTKKLVFLYFGTVFFISIILPITLFIINKNFSNFYQNEIKNSIYQDDLQENINQTSSNDVTSAVATADLSSYKNFILKNSETNEIISLNERDFLIGSLIAEMSYNVPIEALKAQSVASYSYYSVIRALNSNKEYHLNYTNEIYTDPLNKKDEWGENYEEYLKIYEKAVDETLGQSLSYNGQTAYCSFFSNSCGNTESAYDMWGKDIAYLTCTASPYDNFNCGRESTLTFTTDDVRTLMRSSFDYGTMDFTLPYSEWFSNIKYTAGGSVTSVTFCTFTLTGEELRQIFALPSPCFEVFFDGENFIFNTKGSGSQVGMSQTGAAYMAAEGASYIEILNWYYAGTDLCCNKL